MAKYKLKVKLVYNTRSLIALEDLTNKPIHVLIDDMNKNGGLKEVVLLFAAGSGMDFDEAMDCIDSEIENGLDLTTLNEEIQKAFEKSVFYKSPALAAAATSPKSKVNKAKKPTKA